MKNETRRAKLVKLTKEASFLVVILAAVFTWQTWDHVGSGDLAPTFDLAVLDAEEPSTVSTASLAGKPTLVYFWAPWCGVCDVASENVSRVRSWVGDDANVVSIAVSYKSLAQLRDFARENEANYPVLLGSDAELKSFAVTSFPTFYVLDEHGKVRSSVVGYTTTLGLFLRLKWANLVG